MLNFEIVWGHHICLDMAINRSTVNHFGSTALWWIGSDFVRGLHAAMVHHFGLSGNRVEVSSMGWGNEGGLGSRGLGGKLARERRFRSLRVATPNISSFRQAWNFIFETSLLLLGFESQSRGHNWQNGGHGGTKQNGLSNLSNVKRYWYATGWSILN